MFVRIERFWEYFYDCLCYIMWAIRTLYKGDSSFYNVPKTRCSEACFATTVKHLLVEITVGQEI